MNDLNPKNTLTIGTTTYQAAGGAPSPLQPATLESEDFATVLQSLLVNVNQAQQHSRQLTESFERGQYDDLTGVMIAQQKAKLAFQSTLQVRNKLLTAYQDVMNMPI